MLNYGILSCASITERFIKGLLLDKNSNVFSIASRSINKAKEMAQKYNIEKVYDSYDELIKDEVVDVIYIPLINNLHYEFAKKSILNKKHVVLEKPFTLNVEETKELFELAKNNNVFIMEAVKTVFMPSMIYLKDHLSDLGEIKYVHIQKGSDHPFSEGHWMYELNGGGATFANQSYANAILQYLFDVDEMEHKSFQTYEKGKADLSSTFLLKFKNIVVTGITSSDVETEHYMEIYGSKGSVKVYTYWRPKELIFNINGKEEIVRFECDNEFIYEIAHINNCISKGLNFSPILTPNKTINSTIINVDLNNEC